MAEFTVKPEDVRRTAEMQSSLSTIIVNLGDSIQTISNKLDSDGNMMLVRGSLKMLSEQTKQHGEKMQELSSTLSEIAFSYSRSEMGLAMNVTEIAADLTKELDTKKGNGKYDEVSSAGSFGAAGGGRGAFGGNVPKRDDSSGTAKVLKDLEKYLRDHGRDKEADQVREYKNRWAEMRDTFNGSDEMSKTVKKIDENVELLDKAYHNESIKEAEAAAKYWDSRATDNFKTGEYGKALGDVVMSSVVKTCGAANAAIDVTYEKIFSSEARQLFEYSKFYRKEMVKAAVSGNIGEAVQAYAKQVGTGLAGIGNEAMQGSAKALFELGGMKEVGSVVMKAENYVARNAGSFIGGLFS